MSSDPLRAGGVWGRDYGEGGSVQYHLTTNTSEYLRNYMGPSAMLSQPFSRAQQFTAVVSVHTMIDFAKFVFFFNSWPWG